MMKKLGRKISIYTLCVSAAFAFIGCSSDSDSTEDILNEFSISSAVYDNNRTETVADDTLYVYFNKSIDFDAVLADNNISDLLIIDGNGSIDAASIVDYNDTFFHRLKISLGAASSSFDIDTTKIALVTSFIDGFDVSASSVVVNAFRPILKTGQTVVYTANDDGAYQKGVTRSYTDNGDGTIKDNAMGIIWEQEDDGELRDWNASNEYCKNLTKASLSWRMPTIDELVYLMDKGKTNPAINDIFTNVKNAYWSANDYLLSTADDAWTVNSFLGNTNDPDKNTTYYIRCVSSEDDGMTDVTYIRDSAQETVVDTSTNLVWQDDITAVGDENKKSWNEALEFCENLSLADKTDWRLPNLDELNSVTDKTRTSPAMSPEFLNTSSAQYWSSTTNDNNSSKAWYAYFGCGCNDIQDKTIEYNVRCVRSSEN